MEIMTTRDFPLASRTPPTKKTSLRTLLVSSRTLRYNATYVLLQPTKRSLIHSGRPSSVSKTTRYISQEKAMLDDTSRI